MLPDIFLDGYTMPFTYFVTYTCRDESKMETDMGEEQYAEEKNLVLDNSFEARKARKELTIEEWLRLPSKGY